MTMTAMIPGEVEIEPPELGRAMAAMAANPTLTCKEAAVQVGLSQAKLHSMCVRHRGSTPAAWSLVQRLDLAASMLAAGHEIKDVSVRLGFPTPRYFAYAFRRELGVSPALYVRACTTARNEPVRSW